MESHFEPVLILVLMEDTLEAAINVALVFKGLVLILVLMEDTLEVVLNLSKITTKRSLNPCFNGRYSRSPIVIRRRWPPSYVLILVLMEDTLEAVSAAGGLTLTIAVLILVLMEDTLEVSALLHIGWMPTES